MIFITIIVIHTPKNIDEKQIKTSCPVVKDQLWGMITFPSISSHTIYPKNIACASCQYRSRGRLTQGFRVVCSSYPHVRRREFYRRHEPGCRRHRAPVRESPGPRYCLHRPWGLDSCCSGPCPSTLSCTGPVTILQEFNSDASSTASHGHGWWP